MERIHLPRDLETGRFSTGPVDNDRTHPTPPPRMCLRTPILRRPWGPQNGERFRILRLFGQLQGV